MTSTMLAGLPVRQIAYVVADLREAARHHNALFGTGPFFLAEGVSLAGHLYRGVESDIDFHVAFAQFGDLQLELIQLNDDRPSIFRELAPADGAKARLHHVCLHPFDLDNAVKTFEALGSPIVFDYILPGGTRAVMMDSVERLGHFVELYEPTEEIALLYDSVRDCAGDLSPFFRPLASIWEREDRDD